MDRIRSLHTAEWRSAPARQKIRTYLEAIGVPEFDRVVELLQTKYSEQLERFQTVVQERANGFLRADIYDQKNDNLEFSLLVGAAFRGAVHKAVMRWLAESKLSPGSVLDVGCDNGLLTCFYALLWPQAQVTGIDACESGIKRGIELAARLGLPNARFVAVSLEDFVRPSEKQSWDLLLTTTLLQEAGLFRDLSSGDDYLDRAFLAERPANGPPEYCAIANVLSDGGCWIGAELITSPSLVWRWIGALEAAGLSISRPLSRRLKCEDAQDFLSVIAAIKATRQKAEGAWAKEYWNRGPLSVWESNTQMPASFVDTDAQSVFDSITGKERKAFACFGPEGSDLPHSATERIEIWVNETLSLVYRANCSGGIRLVINPRAELTATKEIWDGVVANYKESGMRFDSWVDL